MKTKAAEAPRKFFRQAMRYVSGLICSALSAFFFYAYYERYWRHDFNELGRYYDSETETVYTTSGWIWIVPALFFLLLTLRLLVFRRKSETSGRAVGL